MYIAKTTKRINIICLSIKKRHAIFCKDNTKIGKNGTRKTCDVRN